MYASASSSSLDTVGFGTSGYQTPLSARIASPPTPPIGPNPVKFIAFDGTLKGTRAKLAWSTASEVDSAGFNLFRKILVDAAGKAVEGPQWVKVNAAVIPSLSQGGSGASYAYIDKVKDASKVQYRVEEVPLSNTPPDSIETTVSKKKPK